MQEGWGTCSIHTASVGRGEHTGAAVQPQGQFSVTQCPSVLSTPSTELYSLLANKHNLLPFHTLGMAAEINEQEKDGVLSPACCV